MGATSGERSCRQCVTGRTCHAHAAAIRDHSSRLSVCASRPHDPLGESSIDFCGLLILQNVRKRLTELVVTKLCLLI